jgi:hypothetical protein
VAIESGSAGWRAAGSGMVASYDPRPRPATKCVAAQRSASQFSSSKPSSAPSSSFDTVLSVEFVAKPNHAGQIRDSLFPAFRCRQRASYASANSWILTWIENYECRRCTRKLQFCQQRSRRETPTSAASTSLNLPYSRVSRDCELGMETKRGSWRSG